MTALFQRFEALRADQEKARCDRVAAFLGLFEQQHFARLTTGPVEFNVFSALRVADYEIRHSAFLAWLLDARSEHKQGTKFLRCLLAACDIPYDLSPTTLPVVRVEYRERRAFIDIMVHVPGELLVFIENKIGAPEGDKQLICEFKDMRELGVRLHVPKERQYAVFLTLGGREPTTHAGSHWHRLSYNALAESFEAVELAPSSDKLRYIIRDWIAIARQIVERQ